MRLFHGIDEASGLEGCALALGNFDGVHIGHQALFRLAAQLACPAALTFHPHPGKVLQPDLAPKLITTLSRKLELLEECGIDAVILQAFTAEYARTPSEAFEGALLDKLGARHLVVGTDFTYGSGRSGTVSGLRRAAESRSAKLHVVDPVTVDGVVVSSTKIREYILEGRVGAARRLLGRFFDIDGVVVSGNGRGRRIGVPTANVDTGNELRPAAGVYAVRARLLEGSIKGARQWRAGAANIGVKPTFGGTEVTIEVHLLDFAGELYGQEMRVQFVERLRPEQRFQSSAELVAQIRRDIEAVRTIMARTVE